MPTVRGGGQCSETGRPTHPRHKLHSGTREEPPLLSPLSPSPVPKSRVSLAYSCPQHMEPHNPQPQQLPEWFGGVWTRGKKITDWRTSPQQKGTRKESAREAIPSLKLPQLQSHTPGEDLTARIDHIDDQSEHQPELHKLTIAIEKIDISFTSLTSTEPAELPTTPSSLLTEASDGPDGTIRS